ncbi:nitroreductase family deazaflavin-dependent oxidoreductase [Microbacterium rhizosphaerae]|uniref:Nitroreductase family deazaflavin-dependent oxidoreductase n=1 Tax=Microbacterium rhizosphaerae TaxID=1678237 RepID=A0ABZ0SN94_9MICO|nr:nitroreductase family deazaflavin-dependent oxidoreductase [Microbacterium rhizosphaerae]WPR89645.1 nitroreductase family deazaflavin-dependent oxidoreductase [Microbacterium rhizosphaerae]
MPRWLKHLLSAPNALYTWGLGRIFGHRFLQLTHTGRKSGKQYRVVLEVVKYNRATGEAIVMSGFGRQSGWFRNVTAGTPTWVNFGGGPVLADHRVLDTDEAAQTVRDYARRMRFASPLVRPVLGRLAGFTYHDTDADRRRLVQILPLTAFTPHR